MGKSRIVISCTPEEKKLIREKAERCLLAMGEFCRRSALDIKVIEWFTPEQMQAYKMMMQCHGTLEELAGKMDEDDPELGRRILELIEKLETHLLNFAK